MILLNIISLLKRLYDYDKDTYEHSVRTSNLAIRIAGGLSCSIDLVNTIKDAALLHDIGKLNIPLSILNKHTGLTTPEMECLKKHPIYGEEILELNNFPESIITPVFQHHVWYNGMGYPKVAKKDLCFSALVISIADAIDAMSHKRPYRNALSDKGVLFELEKGRGTQFEPILTDICAYILFNKTPPTEQGMSSYGKIYSIQEYMR